jgi:hypothetical protein
MDRALDQSFTFAAPFGAYTPLSTIVAGNLAAVENIIWTKRRTFLSDVLFPADLFYGLQPVLFG